MAKNKKTLSSKDQQELLRTLGSPSEKHPNRHIGLKWEDVQARLEKHPEKLWSLQ